MVEMGECEGRAEEGIANSGIALEASTAYFYLQLENFDSTCPRGMERFAASTSDAHGLDG
jgi:hypothetical protein